jgi:hypothetical protein
MAMLIGMMITVAGVTLLAKILKESISLPTNLKGDRESKGRIIEIDEYEILDENQNQASEYYKVKINDG